MESVSIPKLQPDGSNWIMYKAQLLFAMESKGCSKHATDAALSPPVPVIHVMSDETTSLNEAQLRENWDS
ncbi:hypothetical protein BOTBODRAFT_113716 [Botryobasidium botryosum FD-172 SS1]|uniref:Uncharacterized protein n=1 Tax=Botryobasidium botryosum (strain FD-172 SS1) TaxID=930990 RepID=A0A067MK04_BOTB1|nr:hypothetical protein BOTBODRAFT_113716 [Botryobasidium botryosum FD-172 SS1]